MHYLPTNTNNKCPSGCYYLPKIANKSQQEQCLLPLTSASFDINIINGLSEVTLIQQYLNTNPTFLQILYKFPISPHVCIHKFSATFSNKRMEGLVKEKQQAKKQFAQAVTQGKKAAYGQIDPNSKDILILKIGNIEPNEKVIIEISYIEELTLTLNTFYTFTLPIKNSPRYMNSISPIELMNSYNTKILLKQRQFQWNFKLRIRSTKKILSFDSKSHKLASKTFNDTNTDIELTLQKGAYLDNDFVLTFTTSEFELPTYTLGRTDVSSTVMVSFIPKFCTLNLEDAKKQALTADTSFETDMDAARGEYIFLLDRSGSMGGSSIQKAKQALILFIKSLPIDTYFNIVSFGSHFQFLFPASIKNSTQSVKSAVSSIQTMKANFGGTEIQNPLKKILQQKIIEGYPKLIFLLTDGEVNNTQSVIDVVRKNIKYSRVHTIGVGNGASQALIKGCAQKGKGHFIFIKNHENPSQKIIQLLNDSLTPVISKIDLQFDPFIVEGIVPNPKSMPYILKGEIVNFYITFKGQLDKNTKISLQYIDSHNNLPYKSDVQISPDSPSEPFIDKMGHFRTIRVLQETHLDGKQIQDQIYFVKNVDLKQKIIEMSVKHQILSQFTSFICVQQEIVDGKYQQVKSKGQQAVQISSTSAPLFVQEQSNLWSFGVAKGQPASFSGFGGSGYYSNNMAANNNTFCFSPPTQSTTISSLFSSSNASYVPAFGMPASNSFPIPPPPPLPTNPTLNLPPPPPLNLPLPPSLPPPPQTNPSQPLPTKHTFNSLFGLPTSQSQSYSSAQSNPFSFSSQPPQINAMTNPMPQQMMKGSFSSKPQQPMKTVPQPPNIPKKGAQYDLFDFAEFSAAPQQNNCIDIIDLQPEQQNIPAAPSQPSNNNFYLPPPPPLLVSNNQPLPPPPPLPSQQFGSSNLYLPPPPPPLNFASSQPFQISQSKSMDFESFFGPTHLKSVVKPIGNPGGPVPTPPKSINQIKQFLQQKKSKKKKNLFDDDSQDDAPPKNTNQIKQNQQKNDKKKINLFDDDSQDDAPAIKQSIPKKKHNIFDDEQQENLPNIKPAIAHPQPQQKISIFLKYDIKEIVKQQKFEGYWSNLSIIHSLYGSEVASSIKSNQDIEAIITYLVWKWIETYHPEKQYSLIAKKAANWLKKQPKYASYPDLYNQLTKNK